MTKTDLISYFSVIDKMKEHVAEKHSRWNEEVMELLGLEMKDDTVIISYKILVDDYNCFWKYYRMEMTVEEFCR